jgi:hypothetical protein
MPSGFPFIIGAYVLACVVLAGIYLYVNGFDGGLVFAFFIGLGGCAAAAMAHKAGMLEGAMTNTLSSVAANAVMPITANVVSSAASSAASNANGNWDNIPVFEDANRPLADLKKDALVPAHVPVPASAAKYAPPNVPASNSLTPRIDVSGVNVAIRPAALNTQGIAEQVKNRSPPVLNAMGSVPVLSASVRPGSLD